MAGALGVLLVNENLRHTRDLAYSPLQVSVIRRYYVDTVCEGGKGQPSLSSRVREAWEICLDEILGVE